MWVFVAGISDAADLPVERRPIMDWEWRSRPTPTPTVESLIAGYESTLADYRSVEFELFYSDAGKEGSVLDLSVTNYSNSVLDRDPSSSVEAFPCKIVDPSSGTIAYSTRRPFGSPTIDSWHSFPPVEFKPKECLHYRVPIPALRANANYRLSLQVPLMSSHGDIAVITDLDLRTNEYGCVEEITSDAKTKTVNPALESVKTILSQLRRDGLKPHEPHKPKIDIFKLSDDWERELENGIAPKSNQTNHRSSPLRISSLATPRRIVPTALDSEEIVPSGSRLARITLGLSVLIAGVVFYRRRHIAMFCALLATFFAMHVWHAALDDAPDSPRKALSSHRRVEPPFDPAVRRAPSTSLTDPSYLKQRMEEFEDTWDVNSKGLWHDAFWVSLLTSRNRIEREQALMVLDAAASPDPSSTGLTGVLLKAAQTIKRYSLGDSPAARRPITGSNVIELVEGESAWDPFPWMQGVKHVNDLVEILSSQIRDEGDSSGRRLRIINYFTCGFYPDKSPDWWLTEYRNTPIAAIFRGEPVTEWGWRMGEPGVTAL